MEDGDDASSGSGGSAHERLQERYEEYFGNDESDSDDADEMDVERAFVEAMAHGKAPFMRAKLCVVGEGRSGKTSTIKAILGMAFDENEASTVGAATANCEIDRTEACEFVEVEKDTKREIGLAQRNAAIRFLANEHDPDLEVATAGNAAPESSGSLARDAKNSTEKTTALELSADDEHERSERIEISQRRFLAKARAEVGDVVKEIGNVELFNREVWEEKAGDDISTKQSLRLSVWDFGGQRVFYDLHHLFLTQEGSAYLLVFNMQKLTMSASKELRDEALSFLRFWLRSLRMHCEGAPCLLVGTHKDIISSSNEHRAINTCIAEAFSSKSNLLQPVLLNLSEDLFFFPVDNRAGLFKDSTLRALKEKIREGILADPSVGAPAPVRWLSLLDELSRAGNPHMTLIEAEDLAFERVAISSTELHAALTKFHLMGQLLWWPDYNLQSLVVLDPQWLVDSISRIIRDFDIHYELDVTQDASSALKRDLTKLRKLAVLTTPVLHTLWPSEIFDDATRDFLRGIMIKMGLMTPLPTRSTSPRYLVPSLLIPRKPSCAAEVLPWSREQTFVIDFARFFLPTGCFSRLSCMLLQRRIETESEHRRCEHMMMGHEAPPVFTSSDCWLSIDGLDFHLEVDEPAQRIRCEVFLQLADRGGANCRVLEFVVQTLEALRKKFAKNLKWEIMLPARETNIIVPLKLVRAQINDKLNSVVHAGKNIPLHEFGLWLSAAKASAGAEDGLTATGGLQAALAHARAMYDLGTSRALGIMHVDIEKYSRVWASLKASHAQELLNLKHAADLIGLQCPDDRRTLRQPSLGFSSTILDEEYLDALYERCEDVRAAFEERAERVSLNVSRVTFHRAPTLKLQSRALEKARLKYGGDLAQLRDILRCKYAVAEVGEMRQLLDALRTEFACAKEGTFEVASIKMKICEDFDAERISGGYRDCNINVFFGGIIAEIQVHLEDFLAAQRELLSRRAGGQTGHDRYVAFRRINERLTCQRSRVDSLVLAAAVDAGVSSAAIKELENSSCAELKIANAAMLVDIAALKAEVNNLRIRYTGPHPPRDSKNSHGKGRSPPHARGRTRTNSKLRRDSAATASSLSAALLAS